MAPILELANQVGATGVVVLDHGRELLSVGDPSAALDCRSIRKPLLGALFGRYVMAGRSTSTPRSRSWASTTASPRR